MKRRLIAVLLILIIAVLAAGGTALLYSTAALQWAFARLHDHLPAGLTVERVEGRLAGPLTIAGLRYESDSLVVSADSVALRWRPGRLFDGVLDVDTLTVSGLEIITREGTQRRTGTAPDFTLPFPIELRRLDAANIVLHRPGREPVTITTLDLSASAQQGTVTLASLHLASPQLTLAAAGKLPLNLRDPVHLGLDWQAAVREWTVAGSGTLGGTWSHLTGELRATQPLALTAAIEIDSGIDAGMDSGSERRDTAPRWRLHAAAEPFVLSTLLPQAPATRIEDATVQAAGGIDAFTADIGLTWDDVRYGRWAVTASAAQDAGRWDLPRFRLQSASGTDVSGHAQARIEGDELRSFLMEADWRNLVWPPAPGGHVLSPRGTLHVTGDAARYDFTLTGELQPPPVSIPVVNPLPPLPLTLTGHGDHAGLNVDTLAGDWLTGAWSGHGTFSWSPSPRWDFALHTEHVDPAGLRPDLAGKLDADLRVRGEYATALALQIDVDRLTGTLRGYPLSARTQIALQPGVIRIDDLQLRSGTATLAAHASLGAEWQLEWQLSAPALTELVPGLAGSLQTQGRVDGPPAALRTRVDIDARELSYRDLYAGALQVHADIDAAPAGRWAIRASAAETGRPDRHKGHLTLQGSGTSQDHALRLAGEQDGYHYEQALSGALHGRQWQARLHDGRLDLATLGPYLQEDSATLTAGPDGYTLQGWCWHQDAARVCLQGSGSPPAAAQGDLRWQQLDVARLATLLPDSALALGGAAIGLGGTGSGELHVAVAAAALQAFSLSFDVTAGTVSYTLPFAATQRHSLNYRQATLKIATWGDRGLHADLNVDIGDGERLDAGLQLPQWDPAAPVFSPQQALAGEVELSLNDLSAIALLAPDLLPGPGHVQTHFTLSGSLGEPQVDGRLDASLETVDIARLGIKLRDINLHVQMEQDRWRLQGDLLSGAGKLLLTGNGPVPNGDTWEGTLALSGQDVEVMRQPIATIIVAPDLTLHFVPGELDITGTLGIPRAQLEPFKGEAAAPVSGDVVIIGGGESRGSAPRLRLHGDLDLVLGDEVRLAGKGLAGRLTGRVHILMNGLDDIKGQGEIRLVEGRYKAYGQDLSIEQGRLLYAGGPIEDPALDLVASRQRESSEGDKIKVGVRVAGTAQRPLVQLFSDPAMDDGDILAYLVLGHPLNKASAAEGQALYQAATSIALVGGEALASRIGGLFDLNEVGIESGETNTDTALVLGKSLSPRIYIRYLQGLVENTSAFQIRYQLNDNWTLQTESGTRSGSGADLIYSIER